MLLVVGLLLAAIILFVTERLKMDMVALLLMLALLLTGILTPDQALAGFSNPIVLMVAGLFVVGAGLTQTGVANMLSTLLSRMARGGEVGLIVIVMLASALLSAFLSTAGATAILLPVVVSLAWNSKLNPSKLLMPLAVGSTIGGMLTLIGTPPNIVVSGQLADAGLPEFGFFSFTPIGLMMLGIGVAFMVLVGRHILPERSSHARSAARTDDESLSLPELAEAYRLPGMIYRLRVEADSPLDGRSLTELDLPGRYGVVVLAVQSWPEDQPAPKKARPVTPATRLHGGDVLHVRADADAVQEIVRHETVDVLPEVDLDQALISSDMGMVELVLTPRSRLAGHTLAEMRFRDRHDVTVIAIMRLGEPLHADVAHTELRFGDTLLAQGTWSKIDLLRQEARDFVVVDQPREMIEAQMPTHRAPLALAIMLGMLLLMTLEILPAVTAVLLAAVAMVLTRCLTMEEAYGSMNLGAVVLLAGMLPLATALQETGGVQYVADGLTATLGAAGPLVMMGVFFLVTSIFSQFMSNTATTILVAPIALQAALAMGVSPQAFMMAVGVSASTSFSTPISGISNTLVLGPGGYRFGDFVRVGVPMQILMLAAAMVAVPLLFPF
jgi:di/tricarboxylate transporter